MIPKKLLISVLIVSVLLLCIYFMSSPPESSVETHGVVFTLSSDTPSNNSDDKNNPTDSNAPKDDQDNGKISVVDPYGPPPVSNNEEANLAGPNAKYCEETNEPLAWKRNLRKHICSERPALYKELKIPARTPEGLYIDDFIPTIALSVLIHSPDHLNVVIRDPNDLRWELPFEDPLPHAKNSQYLSIEESNFDFILNENPFSFKVVRKSTMEVIYNFNEGFVFSNNYIEFAFDLPTKHLYGLGERTFSLQFHPGTYSLFIQDITGEVEDGTPGHNTQGHHSVYLMKERSGNYHMNLLRNINSGELTLNDKNNIKWKLIGGIVDLNFFIGTNNPETAVKKYHEYLGGWTTPAFWALGHHQHKWWGYKDEAALKKVLDGYKDKDLPLDVLWSDIEYLKDNTNFLMDTVNFPPSNMNKLYERYQKRWIPVVQCFIPNVEECAAYNYPNVLDIALRNSNGKIFNGRSWSGVSYLIDFAHPKAEDFWHFMLKYIEDNWSFSGIWLDANELTTLRPPRPADAVLRKYGNLTFYPAGSYLYEDLSMPYPDCKHADGTDEFNVRGLMGYLQGKYTYSYLRQKHKFPFILTRSSIFGTGKYAMHWIADIWSGWEHMKFSIGSIANFNIFGIPFTGTDVCGMVLHPRVEAELCARWYQLGAFYPFSKNGHAPVWEEDGDNSQEPYSWDGDYFVSISKALKLRYSLLKYFYTLFFIGTGKEFKVGTVFRPLFFEFFDDSSMPEYGSQVYEEQFMIGSGIMVAPVTERGKSKIKVHFPKARWYDLRTYQEVVIKDGKDRNIQVSAKLTDLPPFYLRGGYVYMHQDAEKVRRTEDLDNKFDVVVGFGEFSEDGKAVASGYLLDSPSYSEDDIYENCVERDCLLKFEASCEVVKGGEIVVKLGMKRDEAGGNSGEFVTKKIYLLGLLGDLGQLKLKDSGLGASMKATGNGLELNFQKEVKLEHDSQYTFIFSKK